MFKEPNGTPCVKTNHENTSLHRWINADVQLAFKGGLSTGECLIWSWPALPLKTHGNHQHHVTHFPQGGDKQEQLVLYEGELK